MCRRLMWYVAIYTNINQFSIGEGDGHPIPKTQQITRLVANT